MYLISVRTTVLLSPGYSTILHGLSIPATLKIVSLFKSQIILNSFWDPKLTLEV